MEGVGLAVGRDRPALGQVADDLGGIVGIIVQEPAEDSRRRLLDDQWRLGVHVEAARIAVVEPRQDAAGARLVLRLGRGRGERGDQRE